MKLKFIYSPVYFSSLNAHKKCKRTWLEVKKMGKQFEEKYKFELRKIIKEIPKVVGKPWKKKIVEVFIVDWVGPSFSNPLTLRVREDLLLMLVILTHELIHQFYVIKGNTKEIEARINQNVKEVFENLGIGVEKQLKVLEGFYDKRFENII